MAIVGRLAEENLTNIFEDYTINPEHKDLQFKVKWYNNSDLELSSLSGYGNNCLHIELWF